LGRRGACGAKLRQASTLGTEPLRGSNPLSGSADRGNRFRRAVKEREGTTAKKEARKMVDFRGVRQYARGGKTGKSILWVVEGHGGRKKEDLQGRHRL